MSQTRQQAALQKLQQLGIQLSQDSFVDYVETGDPCNVPLFIDAGLDVNDQDSKGSTPLTKAAHIGYLPMVSSLAACRNADLDRKNRAGWTPLMMAAQKGHTDVVCFLVGEDAVIISITGNTADAMITNNNGETALMIAEKSCAPQELIDCLKKAGATQSGPSPTT